MESGVTTNLCPLNSSSPLFIAPFTSYFCPHKDRVIQEDLKTTISRRASYPMENGEMTCVGWGRLVGEKTLQDLSEFQTRLISYSLTLNANIFFKGVTCSHVYVEMVCVLSGINTNQKSLLFSTGVRSIDHSSILHLFDGE